MPALSSPIATRFTRLATKSSGRVFSFIDQGFQGVSNLVVTLLIARGLPVEAFATVGLMLGLYYFAFSYHRVCIVLPYILDASVDVEPQENDLADWWGASLWFTLGIEILLGVTAALIWSLSELRPDWLWVAQATGLLALILPTMVAGEFGRRAFYQTGHARSAALASMAYFVAGVSWAFFAGSSLLAAVASFAVAGTASTAIFLVLVRPHAAGLYDSFIRWRPHAELSFWQALSSTFFVLYTTSAVVLVATFAGPIAAAVYTAVRTVVNPALSIVSAVDSLDKPRAARALAQGGIVALQSSIKRTRRLLFILTGSFLLIVVIFAPWILSHFFGSEYAPHVTAARVLALGFLMMCLNQPSETMLLVLRRPRLVFIVRLGAAILAVVGVWLGARQLGVLGTAVAITGVQAAVLIALQVAERIAARDWAKSSILNHEA